MATCAQLLPPPPQAEAVPRAWPLILPSKPSIAFWNSIQRDCQMTQTWTQTGTVPPDQRIVKVYNSLVLYNSPDQRIVRFQDKSWNKQVKENRKHQVTISYGKLEDIMEKSWLGCLSVGTSLKDWQQSKQPAQDAPWLRVVRLIVFSWAFVSDWALNVIHLACIWLSIFMIHDMACDCLIWFLWPLLWASAELFQICYICDTFPEFLSLTARMWFRWLVSRGSFFVN